MEPFGYVFISYSRQDIAFVRKLVYDLKVAGIDVWIDVEQIMPGSNWGKSIEQGTMKATVLLYVSSRHSFLSQWMAKELEVALDSGKKVIPIIIDDEGQKNIPIVLSTIQWVDFRKDYNKALDKLKAGLKEIISTGSNINVIPEKTKGYIFLSYAEEDNHFLAKLRKFLGSKGYSYWDYEESDRDYHIQYHLELEEVINGAAATLSILSPAWKRSQWAIKEYLYSVEVNKPVFLLKAKEMKPTLIIAGIPFIDFLKDEISGFQKLDHELKRKNL